MAPTVGLEAKESARVDVHPQTSVVEARIVTAGSARNVVDAGAVGPSNGPTDAEDSTLARALSLAVNAGRLDLVATIVEELRARRLASSPNVVTFPSKASR